MVPIFKTACLKWNLVHRLNWISRIHWWCSLFPFSTRNTLFRYIWSKYQNCQFKVKFGTSTNLNMQNSMMFTFSVFDWKYLFWVNGKKKKSKWYSLRWNLVLRLIRICRIQWSCSLFPFSTCKFCPKNQFGVLVLHD